jgi:acyl carrier protein
MELNKFVSLFAAQFEETAASNFNSDTVFRNLEEWSSLTSLSVIAMVDEEYNIKLTGDDIRSSKTILDIFKIIEAKIIDFKL